jgi:metal-sulfur cluster biosynthetic enzyme
MTKTEALAALATVLDPEVGIDIVNLGLIVDTEIADDGVTVRMIMTSAACPMHGHLAAQAEQALAKVGGADCTVKVEIVNSPTWTPERMSDEARKKLGW